MGFGQFIFRDLAYRLSELLLRGLGPHLPAVNRLGDIEAPPLSSVPHRIDCILMWTQRISAAPPAAQTVSQQDRRLEGTHRRGRRERKTPAFLRRALIAHRAHVHSSLGESTQRLMGRLHAQTSIEKA